MESEKIERKKEQAGDVQDGNPSGKQQNKNGGSLQRRAGFRKAFSRLCRQNVKKADQVGHRIGKILFCAQLCLRIRGIATRLMLKIPLTPI